MTVHSIDLVTLRRVVVPGHPHHVTQRGNGHVRTFFSDLGYALYRDLLAANCAARPGSGVGLVPDAEPHAPHRLPESRQRARTRS